MVLAGLLECRSFCLVGDLHQDTGTMGYKLEKEFETKVKTI